MERDDIEATTNICELYTQYTAATPAHKDMIFEQLCARTHRYVCTVLRRMYNGLIRLGDSEDELKQDVRVATWKATQSCVTEKGAFTNWVIVQCKKMFGERYRQRKNRGVSECVYIDDITGCVDHATTSMWSTTSTTSTNNESSVIEMIDNESSVIEMIDDQDILTEILKRLRSGRSGEERMRAYLSGEPMRSIIKRSGVSRQAVCKSMADSEKRIVSYVRRLEKLGITYSNIPSDIRDEIYRHTKWTDTIDKKIRKKIFEYEQERRHKE